MLERLKDNRIVATARALSDRYADDGGAYLSAAIAYFGFLSLFPLLLLAFSVIGFVLAGSPGVADDISSNVAAAVPGLDVVVGNNLRAFKDARAATGLLGVAGLLWTGAGVVGAARNALLRIFREERITSGIRLRLWLLTVTVGVGLLALGAMALSTVATGWDVGGPLGPVVRVAGVVLAFGLDVVVFLAAYRGLLRRRHPWADLFPGALFAAFGWSLLKVAGTWYATTTVERSDTVYGAFAATVGVLVLLYLAGRVFVYGAELNAVLIEQRGGGPMDRNGPSDQAADPRELSTVQLVGRVAGDAGTLVRKELELARQEMKEAMAAKAQGAAAFGAAAVFGLYLLGFLAAAGAAALALVLQLWAALLIVAGVFLILALIAAAVGRSRMASRPVSPEKAKANLKEDVQWAKAQLRR